MNLQKALNSTVYASLFVQMTIGILDIYVATLPVPAAFSILKKLLGVEIFVQFIEGWFYVWFARNIHSIKNVTPIRYFDWAITTPTMLYTLCVYLDFINTKSNVKHKKDDETVQTTDIEKHIISDHESPKQYTLIDSFKTNAIYLIPIFLLNLAMLLFGYLGEIKVIPTTLSVTLGFIPFICVFTIIYQQYAKYTQIGQVLFWSFSGIWALYGIAALMSYYWKNIMYNVLDLFAKNFFGLFIAHVIYQEYKVSI
jgi:hypothetical protein